MVNKGKKENVFWVGIGASAGGLEALRELVRNLSPDIGAIYVVLQHMSPQHKSLLTELVGRETPLNVYEITDGMTPECDSIYIGPPNHDVIVRAGRLRLQAPSTEPAAPKPSVDRFFLSLAETLGDRAVGIILSGTGSDGAYGVQAIRAAGGITIAQSESTAKYNGMPLAAVDTGCVDLVLAPEEIGARFARVISLPRNLNGLSEEAPQDSMSSLLQMLHASTGVDFREYKPSTVRRRIDRRMTALGLNEIDDYANHIRENAEETKTLFRDMMISVTSFFRDPEEFEHLKRYIATEFADIRKGRHGLRVWVPGCASGEEAYSIAILLAEFLGGIAALDEIPLQIFATDIDSVALATARRGLYPDSAARDIPKDLLEAYFTRTDGGYQVNQALRERIVFTPHNLCQDPPFSNIDLISCRNLLIYFSNSLQSKVFARLHYALKPSGLLFVGKSESISGSETLFRPAVDHGQIFHRRSFPEGTAKMHRRGLETVRLPYDRSSQRSAERTESADPFGAMFHALVRTIGPNGLLVTSDLHIHRVYGNIDKYLSLQEGQLRGATIAMLRDDIRHELRTLISLTLRSGRTRLGLERRLGEDETSRLQIQVHPIGVAERSEDLALVIFREWEENPRPAPRPPENDDAASARINELEQELVGMRESLQQTVEELETANEELQSLNEELQSANEELQSTNEELETTNEELQSTNEELITVNEELQINSHEMTLINQELDSVLSNIAAPVLVVDSRLHIVQCSQSARTMFQIESGVAKPHLSQLSLPGEFPPLTSFLAEVIQTGARSEREIDTDLFRGTVIASPYFNPKGELIGATAIVQKISDPRVQDLENLLDTLPLMIWQKDAEDRIVSVNSAAADFMGVTRGDAKGQTFGDLITTDTDALRMAEKEALSEGRAALDIRARVEAKNGTQRELEKLLVPYQSENGSKGLFVVARELSDDVALSGWWVENGSQDVTLSPEALGQLGLEKAASSEGVLSIKDWLERFHPDDRDPIHHGLKGAFAQAIAFTVLARLKVSGSEVRKAAVTGHARRGEDGKVTSIAGEISMIVEESGELALDAG